MGGSSLFAVLSLLGKAFRPGNAIGLCGVAILRGFEQPCLNGEVTSCSIEVAICAGPGGHMRVFTLAPG
jgi:hypothetical protein